MTAAAKALADTFSNRCSCPKFANDHARIVGDCSTCEEREIAAALETAAADERERCASLCDELQRNLVILANSAGRNVPDDGRERNAILREAYQAHQLAESIRGSPSQAGDRAPDVGVRERVLDAIRRTLPKVSMDRTHVVADAVLAALLGAQGRNG